MAIKRCSLLKISSIFSKTCLNLFGQTNTKTFVVVKTLQI